MIAFFKSLIPNRPSRKIDQKPKTPSPPKAKTSTPTSQKSNRATRGSTASRSVYYSRAPELTDAVVAKQVKTPSKSNSATRERLEDHPAKTATATTPLKKKPINMLSMLNNDVLNKVINEVALKHSQQIVLDKAFIKFYMTSAKNLRGAVNIDIIDKNLLSNLHTIYLDELKIKENIIKILEKTLRYSSITTIILSTIEFPSNENATAFFTFLRKNAPNLKNLIIRASPKISNENIVKLISAISGLNKLVLLELSGFDFTGVYTGTFTFDDMFINLLIFLPDLEYLVFNNNIIDEHHYRRIFISTYAISAPKSETSIKDRYNMYIKSEYMKFYDKGNALSAQTPSYFFDLIKFRYAEKADVQIYRDIFFYTIRNKARTNAEGTLKYLATFDTNPVLNVYRSSLLSKYPKELNIPIMKRDTGKKVALPT